MQIYKNKVNQVKTLKIHILVKYNNNNSLIHLMLSNHLNMYLKCKWKNFKMIKWILEFRVEDVEENLLLIE